MSKRNLRCLARRDVKAILAVGKVEETSKIGSTSCRLRLAGKMGDGDVDVDSSLMFSVDLGI